MEQILQALHRPGYTTDGPDFAIGRPDRATLPLANRAGVPVVAMLFPAGGGERTFANMQELWRAAVPGARGAPLFFSAICNLLDFLAGGSATPDRYPSGQ